METATRLEDGWGLTTPVGDTLLRRYVLNLAAFHEAVARAMGGRTLCRDDVVAADLGHPAGLYNSAVLLRPPERLDNLVMELESFYDGHGCGDVELWSAWPTSDLTGRGWELEGHPPLLVRPAGPAPGSVTRLDCGLRRSPTQSVCTNGRTWQSRAFRSRTSKLGCLARSRMTDPRRCPFPPGGWLPRAASRSHWVTAR